MAGLEGRGLERITTLRVEVDECLGQSAGWERAAG